MEPIEPELVPTQLPLHMHTERPDRTGQQLGNYRLLYLLADGRYTEARGGSMPGYYKGLVGFSLTCLLIFILAACSTGGSVGNNGGASSTPRAPTGCSNSG